MEIEEEGTVGREDTFIEEGLDEIMDIVSRPKSDPDASKDDSRDSEDGEEEESVEEEAEEGGEEAEDSGDEEGEEDSEDDGEDGEGEDEGEDGTEEDSDSDDSITMSTSEHAALLEQINALSGEKIKDVKVEELDFQKKEKGDLVEPKIKIPEGEVFFKDEEALDEVLTDVDSANKFFGQVLVKGQEQILRALPTLVTEMIEKRTVLQSAAMDFYKNNEDLKPYGKFIGLITTELAAKDPTKPVDELLVDVANEVRDRLKLKKSAVKKKKDVPKPKLPKKKSRTRNQRSSRMSELEKEVNDLIDL